MNRMMKLLLPLFIFSTVAYSAEEPMDTMRVAVIWNSRTTNADAPYGWSVGGNDKSPTGNDIAQASEVGKAQLKFYLNSLDSRVGTWGTLDDENIKNSVTDNSGVVTWEEVILPNVRVYDHAALPASYAAMKDHFGGEAPHLITYINSGAPWSDNKEEKEKLFKILFDGSDDNVGIIFIGSRSATDARDLDPEQKTFPVMGVQKMFRLQQADGDIVQEFNFLADNDEYDAADSLVREVADTVQLFGDDTQGYWMTLVSTGVRIYESKLTATVDLWGNPVNQYDAGEWKTGFKAIYNNAVIHDSLKPDIRHRYGEWSIRAKAVEVIDVDLYAAEMNVGIAQEHDFQIGRIGTTKKIRILDRSWSIPLYINGKRILKKGASLDTLPGFDYNWETNTFNEDLIIEVSNPENSNIKDKICVIRKGTSVVTVESVTTTENGTYPGTFKGGGLRDLRIDLATSDDMFADVFPSLGGVDHLDFKPWSVGGRLSADADIWEVNNQLLLKGFDEIFDKSAGENKFDANAYYTVYLGDQQAGKNDGNYNQFIRPPSTFAAFDNPAIDDRASELPATSVGGETDADYLENYEGKLYHAIAAIQKAHQRLLILGFQPTYLANSAHATKLLSDATRWVGFNQYQLPTPEIKANGVKADGQELFTDHSQIEISVDPTQMSEEMRGRGRAKLIPYQPHVLKYMVEYDGAKKTGESPLAKRDVQLDAVISILVDLPNTPDTPVPPTDDRKIVVKAWIEPVSEMFLLSKKSKAVISYKKLVQTFAGPSRGANDPADLSTMTLYRSDALQFLAQYDAEDVASAKISWTLDGEPQAEIASGTKVEMSVIFAGVSGETVEIVAYSQKPDPKGYLTSDPKTITVKVQELMTPQDVGGKYYDANGDGIIDAMRMTFDNLFELPKSVVCVSPFDSKVSATITNTALFKIAGTDLIVTFPAENNETFGLGTGFPTGEYATFSGKYYGDGSGSVTGKVSDGVIPVIDEASYKEGRVGASDTLFVKFTEEVKDFLTAEANTFKLYSPGASDISVKHLAYDPVAKEHSFEVISLGVNTNYPSKDALLNINATADVEDLLGNIQNDPNNRKVALDVGDQEAINTQDGGYYDGDGDGIIDSFYMVFDTLIAIPDSIVLINPFDSNDSVVITDSALLKPDEMNGIGIKFPGFKTLADSTGFVKSDYVKLFGDRYAESGTPVTVVDKIAPIVEGAEYTPGTVPYGSDETEPDTLRVQFSEGDVKFPEGSNPIFILHGEDGKQYPVHVTLLPGKNDGYYYFEVDSIEGKNYPSKGDSLNINATAGVEDGLGNIQDNKENEKIGVVVNSRPINLKIYTLWMNDVGNGSIDAGVIASPVLGSWTGVDVQSLIILDPVVDIGDLASLKFNGAVILDPVGNVVVSASTFGEGSHLRVIQAKIQENDRTGIVIGWDAKNTNGRVVGAGTYQLLIETEWPGYATPILSSVSVRVSTMPSE